MKIVNIVGARPQFIKYFPIQSAITSSNTKIEDILVHTGQHYDYSMSEVFFRQLGIKTPKYHLGIGSGSHGVQTGEMLKKFEDVLVKETPDAVIVYGDTNSTMAGALSAVKLHIPVVHVEAGLRSYNKKMPEEINRVLTDHSSSILLCPTKTAVSNLRNEGFSNIINDGEIIPLHLDELLLKPVNIDDPIVINVGDVMYDSLLHALTIASNSSKILSNLNLIGDRYCVLTLHRAENTTDISRIKELIDFVANVLHDKKVIFSIHPRTKKVLQDEIRTMPDNIIVIEPVGYFDMLWLVKNSSLVMTDSGGLQKEAYWLKVPCITLRDETEWVETIESGWNILYKDYNSPHKPQTSSNELYGDGRSAERIINIVTTLLGK